MRILHLNRDNFGGGAYRSALRLHNALRAQGQDSRLLVGMRRGRDVGAETLVFSDRPADGLCRAVRRLLLAADRARYRGGRRRVGGLYEAFDDDRSQYGKAPVAALPPCDVLNLHFVSGLVDMAGFFPAITERTAVVWTLHDMNPFSGGCHFDDGCGRWRDGCGCCPQLASRDPGDLSAQVWRRKRRSLETVAQNRLCIVAPSRWMARAAAESPLLKRFRVETIPYSVDAGVYKPRDRAMCREVLGLAPDARIVLFIAQQIRNRRKGYAVLVEALNRLAHLPRLQLVTVGIDVPPLSLPVPVRHLGNVRMDGLVTLAYNAADVFAVPSLQDNLPNTVLESLACGTPVAGFDVGGIPDMVRHGETGCLAAAGDSAALARAIERIVTDAELARDMGRRGREVAERKYAANLQAGKHATLFQSMLR